MKDRAGRCQQDVALNPHQVLVRGQWTLAGVAPRVFCLSHGHAASFSHVSDMYVKSTLSNPPCALSLKHLVTRLTTLPTGALPAALTCAACLIAQSELKCVGTTNESSLCPLRTRCTLLLGNESPQSPVCSSTICRQIIHTGAWSSTMAEEMVSYIRFSMNHLASCAKYRTQTYQNSGLDFFCLH